MSEVVDVHTGEQDGNELKGMMRRLKAEVSLKNTSEKLPYTASDGKTYKRDFVDSRGLYQSVAYLRAKKDRPILKNRATESQIRTQRRLVELVDQQPKNAGNLFRGHTMRPRENGETRSVN